MVIRNCFISGKNEISPFDLIWPNIIIFSRNQEQPKDLTEVQKAISAHEAESSEVEGRRNKFAQLHGS